MHVRVVHFQFLLFYSHERNEQLVQERNTVLWFRWWKHTTCHVVMRAWKSFSEPSMDHLIAANKKNAAKISSSPSHPLTSLLPPPLLFISHGLMHKNTFQSWRNMAAYECKYSPPHKWKWLICHSPSWVAFLFFILNLYLFIFPSSRRNELNLASLLIAPSLPACLLSGEYKYIYICVCNKAQKPIFCFLFPWHLCPMERLEVVFFLGHL